MHRRIVLSVTLLLTTSSAFSSGPSVADDDDAVGRTISQRVGPYVQMKYAFGNRQAAREADKHRLDWEAKYELLSIEERVRYCIYQLRNETWSLGDDLNAQYHPYPNDPEGVPSHELVKIGRPAIPQLIEALECRAPTGMQYTAFTGQNNDGKYLVQDAAYIAIEKIACRYFSNMEPPLGLNSPKETQKCLEKVRRWWERNKNSDEAKWATDNLFHENLDAGERSMAIDSLYLRLGKKSFPIFIKAYLQFSKLDENSRPYFDMDKMLSRILDGDPPLEAKPVFENAVKDPIDDIIFVKGAEGLWRLGDASGLDSVIKDINVRIRNDPRLPLPGQSFSVDQYTGRMLFLARCDTPRSRSTIYKSLRAPNPHLRFAAILACSKLATEESVRALPKLFDDTFVIRESRKYYDSHRSSWQAPMAGNWPTWHISDEAAATFGKFVPSAPRFDPSTTELQRRSIARLKQWWNVNGQKLVWNEKSGFLERPTRMN